MKEKHLFGDFVPGNSEYMILGSFTAKNNTDSTYTWFYGKKVNQFWPIIEKVYNLKLETVEKRKALFIKLKIALADQIMECERSKNNSSDNNLINCKYNLKSIKKIIENKNIKKIFFSSRYSENIFKKYLIKSIQMPSYVQLITLPSPSPRYARISINEKVEVYKKNLPKLIPNN